MGMWDATQAEESRGWPSAGLAGPGADDAAVVAEYARCWQANGWDELAACSEHLVTGCECQEPAQV